MRRDAEPYRVLFVCLGNICRSPLAEGILRQLLQDRGLEARVEVDSAGTGAWHVGEPPDPRSIEVALRNGIALDGRGRQVRSRDFSDFDLLVAMDAQNRIDLQQLRSSRGDVDVAEIRLLREFEPSNGGGLDVPDPYYGGARGFDDVFEMVYRSCEGLLDAIEARLSGSADG